MGVLWSPGATRAVFAGRVRVDYAFLLGSRRAALLLAKWLFNDKRCFVEAGTGCWRCFRVGSNGYACTGIRLTDGKARGRFYHVQLHRVAFLAWHGRDTRPGMVASHLCGRRDCFNPSHITEESQAMNVSRSSVGCAGQIVCRQHGCVLEEVCGHVPACRQVLLVSCCRSVGTRAESRRAESETNKIGDEGKSQEASRAEEVEEED